MPLGSLNTDLVWKNSTEETANFQDPGNFVKRHLMFSQVQHQKSYSKNATNVAFFPRSHPYPQSCQSPMCLSGFSSSHSKGNNFQTESVPYHHKSIFTG